MCSLSPFSLCLMCLDLLHHFTNWKFYFFKLLTNFFEIYITHKWSNLYSLSFLFDNGGELILFGGHFHFDFGVRTLGRELRMLATIGQFLAELATQLTASWLAVLSRSARHRGRWVLRRAGRSAAAWRRATERGRYQVVLEFLLVLEELVYEELGLVELLVDEYMPLRVWLKFKIKR